MNVVKIISDKLLEEKLISAPIIDFNKVNGGCINNCLRIKTKHKQLFVKINRKAAFPEMFNKEVKGLAILRNAHTINTPKEILQFEKDDYSFLILEWIDSGNADKNFWFNFGKSIAELHQQSNDEFGLDYDNYIGSLSQYNRFRKDWSTFFLENRLIPQLELGIEKTWASKALFKYAEKATRVVEQEFPTEKPSLLHGDLWSGNFLISNKSEPYLIDPAVYFGNREMEIAFTMLFGGFDALFYDSYTSNYPIQEGFKSRLELLQLYPLLVHANLFGGNYLDQSLRILKKF